MASRVGSYLWAVAVLACLPGADAFAGAYYGRGTLGRDITVCFVGDAVTKRPDRVKQILTWIKEFEYAANIRFRSLGACPPARTLPDGSEVFEGDIRVVIPKTSVNATIAVPGKGCDKSENSGWGSWSRFPGQPGKVHCLFTLKLGDNPWHGEPYLNHTLHEFGHALGLVHEHSRVDADRTRCADAHIGGKISKGLITTYDAKSVMHYASTPECGIAGNYGRNGLSEKDRLTVHILYPEEIRVAEFIGKTVLREGEALRLAFAWRRRGAIVDNVAARFEWKIDGKPAGTKPDLDVPLAAGVHRLEYRYIDLLGRNYSYKGTVRVLPQARFVSAIAAPLAARAALY